MVLIQPPVEFSANCANPDAKSMNPAQNSYERVSFNGKHDKPRTLAHRNGSRNINPQEVTRLARSCCTNREIAAHFGVSDDTISRRFAGSLEKGRVEGRLSLRR